MSQTKRFELFNTEERHIVSTQAGRAYRIGVWLPFSYHSTHKTYPVLYVPDGEFAFPMAAGLIPTLIGNGEAPEMLVVGIAYQDIRTWQEHGQLRDQDFLSARFQEKPEDSRLEAFTGFFQQELFPLIEREYRGSPEDRGLFGFSSGGLFALHALLTRPGMFRRVVATSCTWPGADEEILAWEQGYAGRSGQPAAQVYLSVGEKDAEQLGGFAAVVERLRGRQESGLRLFSEMHAGEGHSSGALAKAFLHGVRAVYAAG